MCGIFGVYSPNITDETLKEFNNSLKTVSHRGPDESNSTILSLKKGFLKLGHNRLSILDLSATGSQPMDSISRNSMIIFNGEIYNHLSIRKTFLSKHTFRGSSDTETLVNFIEAFGIDFALKHLEGMFAFVFFNRKENRIILARDIPGEKPLYLMTSKESIGFSSDISNLASSPGFKREINKSALNSLLSYGYIPNPISIYNRIYKLPPSYSISIDLDNFKFADYLSFADFISSPGVSSNRYWSYTKKCKENLSDRYTNFNEAKEDLRSELQYAVKSQLISDVPLGAFLSGGIDSSLIVSLMKDNLEEVNTFNIGFELSNFDESVYASGVAGHLQTNHRKHICTKSDATDFIKKLHLAYTEPFADSSQIPTMLISNIASKEVKVCLTGDAGDEIFGGYNRYFITAKYWNYLKVLPQSIRDLLAVTLTKLPVQLVEKMIFHPLKIALSGNNVERVNQIANKLSKAQNEELFFKSFITEWDFGEIGNLEHKYNMDNDTIFGDQNFFADLDFVSFPEKMMLFDFETYLTDDILCKVDRASMYSSLETRAPFLSKNILNFSSKLPPEYKIHNGKGKFILRSLLEDYLPKELFERPKAGFGIPIGQWINSELSDWADESLSKEVFLQHGMIDYDLVAKTFDAHRQNRGNFISRLWPVIQFNNWYRFNF